MSLTNRSPVLRPLNYMSTYGSKIIVREKSTLDAFSNDISEESRKRLSLVIRNQ